MKLHKYIVNIGDATKNTLTKITVIPESPMKAINAIGTPVPKTSYQMIFHLDALSLSLKISPIPYPSEIIGNPLTSVETNSVPNSF